MKTQSTYSDRVKAITKKGKIVHLTLRSFDRFLHVGRIAFINNNWQEV